MLRGTSSKVHQAKSILLEEAALYSVTHSSGHQAPAHDVYPPEWLPDAAPSPPHRMCARVAVVLDSDEWNKVRVLFQSTMPEARIVAIERLQNKSLYGLFSFRLKALRDERGGAEPARLPLFHGTRGTDPKEIYDSMQGFMLNFASEGLWGLDAYTHTYDVTYTYIHTSIHTYNLCL